jgi:glycosyltransferase involved in cell wall biosynthesis
MIKYKVGKIKIIFVIGQLGIGGAERQLYYLIKRLDPNKYLPSLIILSDLAEMGQEFEQLEIPIYILKRRLPGWDITRLMILIHHIRIFTPDLLHSFLLAANIYSCLAGRLTRVPVVVSERNAEPSNSPDVTFFQRLAERQTIPWATKMIANSKAGAASAMQRSRIDSKKIHVVYNGIDLNRFTKKDDKARALRHELGLKERVPVIGIVGSMVGPRKDHATFLRAMQIVRQSFRSDLQLLCVGGGPGLRETQRLVENLGLAKNVTFAGVRFDVPEILGILDILVSSSQWEGMPNVIMEAMAAGKPVVATNVGGTPELVEHGRTGLLVPPKNPVSLAAAVQYLLEHPELAGLMGTTGREKIEQHFTLKKMVKDTENIYRELLLSQSA